jgi:hypothetical protein
MIKGLLTSMGLAGLLVASVLEGSVAAPIAPAASEIIAPRGQSLERVYYYNGPTLRVPLQQSILCASGLPAWPLALLLKKPGDHARHSATPSVQIDLNSASAGRRSPSDSPLTSTDCNAI